MSEDQDPMLDAALDVVDEAETFLAACDAPTGGEVSVVVVFMPGGPMGAVPVEVPITGIREAVGLFRESVERGPKAEALARAEEGSLPRTAAPTLIPTALEPRPEKPEA